MQEEEVWKDVVGFEEYFQVSNLGRILGKRSGKILKGSITSSGYRVINSRIDNRQGPIIHFIIHRAVAEAFLEKPSHELIEYAKNTFYGIVPVNHKDGDKLNNCADNLEWCTYKENSTHAVSTGLIIKKFGLENPTSKLSKEQIDYIVENYIPYDREFGARAIAKKFGVAHTAITRAYRYNKHIPVVQ